MKSKKLILISAVIIVSLTTWYFNPFHKPIESVDVLIGKIINTH
jgi:antibiotic biosynthesis monooxygenase (ABM) superfamily enzyme